MMPTFLTNADFVRYGKSIEKMIENEPALANRILVYDVWDKEGFTTIHDVEMPDNEGADFVDFCNYETTPLEEWYEGWKISPSKDDITMAERRAKHGVEAIYQSVGRISVRDRQNGDHIEVKDVA
jgi:hypothetical protein